MNKSDTLSAIVLFWLLTTPVRLIRSENVTGYGNPETPRPPRLYIGSFNAPNEEGISIYEMNKESVFQKRRGLVVRNPSYLVYSSTGRFIYSGNELHGDKQGQIGKITAYSINNQTTGIEQLSTLNWLNAEGGYPAHVSLDPTGRFVLSANYGSGNVVVMSLQQNGRLDRVVHITEAPAGDPHAAKAHMVSFHPTQKGVIGVAYMGLDKVYFSTFDSSNEVITPLDIDRGSTGGHRQLHVKLAKGAGPRHFVFTPDGRFLYVVGELHATVTVFEWFQDQNTKTVGYTLLQTISTLPLDYSKRKKCGEIRLHPNGKFLYVSNRGHDSIATFVVNRRNGRILALSHYPTGGHTPRHFTLAHDGGQLIVGNQDSNTVAVFHVHPRDGSLSNRYIIPNYIQQPAFILYV